MLRRPLVSSEGVVAIAGGAATFKEEAEETLTLSPTLVGGVDDWSRKPRSSIVASLLIDSAGEEARVITAGGAGIDGGAMLLKIENMAIELLRFVA